MKKTTPFDQTLSKTIIHDVKYFPILRGDVEMTSPVRLVSKATQRNLPFYDDAADLLVLKNRVARGRELDDTLGAILGQVLHNAAHLNVRVLQLLARSLMLIGGAADLLQLVVQLDLVAARSRDHAHTVDSVVGERLLFGPEDLVGDQFGALRVRQVARLSDLLVELEHLFS